MSRRDNHVCRLREPSTILLRARVKTHLQGPTRSFIRYKSIYKVFGLRFWLRLIGAKHRKMEHRSAVATRMPLVSNNFYGGTSHMQSSGRSITQSYRPTVISLRDYHCALVQEILPVVLGYSVFPGRLCLSANSVHHRRGAIHFFSNISLSLSRIDFDVQALKGKHMSEGYQKAHDTALAERRVFYITSRLKKIY